VCSFSLHVRTTPQIKCAVAADRNLLYMYSDDVRNTVTNDRSDSEQHHKVSQGASDVVDPHRVTEVQKERAASLSHTSVTMIALV
jgi:hypothetical protein